MGIYFRSLGFIFWFIGVTGGLVFFEVIRSFGGYAYALWIAFSVLIGLLFIALGEVMILLNQNLQQNQALYKLFENWGGENQ